MLLGAVEAGGTKIIVGIGNEQGELYEKMEFPTGLPDEAVKKIVDYFKDKEITALGIGTFGPVDVHKDSKTYGYILDTPKQNWSMYPLLDKLKEHLHVPMIIDTDVNGAALGEIMWGAAKEENSCLYMTIGTGIGGGFCMGNTLLHGLLHPEMGHILLRQHEKDTYKGHCPFHGNCFEGLAAGPAIEDRHKVKAYTLPSDHLAWEIEAYYIAQALVSYTLTLSPEKIVLGGGVMKQKHLFPMIHKYFKEMMNEYIKKPQLMEEVENFIVYPGLGDNSGTYGALALATLLLS